MILLNIQNIFFTYFYLKSFKMNTIIMIKKKKKKKKKRYLRSIFPIIAIHFKNKHLIFLFPFN